MQGLIGISPTQVKTSSQVPEFKLGTLGLLNPTNLDAPEGDKVYMYVETSEAITDRGYACVVDSAFVAEMLDTTSSAPGAGAGRPVGAAQAAIESGGFGWIQVYGRGPLRTLASAALGTELNSTGTPGAVDDNGAASEAIQGLSLGTASGGAPETNEDAFFNWPTVGRTLA